MAARGEPAQAYFRTRFTAVQAREHVWRVVCRHLARYVPPRSIVLDLGAGYCSFINQVRAAEKHALDVFDGVLRHAASDVQAHVGVCSDLGRFADGQFTVVFASNLLEHLTRSEVRDTLKEVDRVLRPGGRLILIQPNYRYCSREYFDDYTHQFVFSHVSLPDLLLSSGFSIEAVEPRFLPLTFKGRVPHWSWLVKLYLRLPVRPFAKQMLVVATRP